MADLQTIDLSVGFCLQYDPEDHSGVLCYKGREVAEFGEHCSLRHLKSTVANKLLFIQLHAINASINLVDALPGWVIPERRNRG